MKTRRVQSGIYRIVHIETNREYIGSAVCFSSRWSNHRIELNAGIHFNAKLQNAWTYYGEAAFAFEVVEYVTEKTLLLEREQWHIDTRHPFYNIRKLASSNLGLKHSPESLALMSQVIKGHWEGNDERRRVTRERALKKWGDPIEREKAIAGMRGKPRSPEMRAKISATLTGRKPSEATRAIWHAQRSGKPQGPHSEETKRRIGDAQRGKKRPPRSPETCAKLSAALKGKKKSPEHIEKMRANARGRIVSEETRAKHRARPPFRQTPETIAKAKATRLANQEKKRVEARTVYQSTMFDDYAS